MLQIEANKYIQCVNILCHKVLVNVHCASTYILYLLVWCIPYSLSWAACEEVGSVGFHAFQTLLPCSLHANWSSFVKRGPRPIFSEDLDLGRDKEFDFLECYHPSNILSHPFLFPNLYPFPLIFAT